MTNYTKLIQRQIQVQVHKARIRRALEQRIAQSVSILSALGSGTYDEQSAKDDLFDLTEGSPDGLIHALEQLAYEGEEQ